VAAVLALTTAAGLWHGQHYHTQWQYQWASSVLLAAATFGIAMAVRNRKIPRVAAWLGVISFSVYLLHPLVFNAYRSIPALHHKHPVPDQIALFAAIVAVIIAASAVTYYLVEKPMQRLGRRVAGRTSYATGVGSRADERADAGELADADGVSVATARSTSSSSAVAGGSGGSP
jgi:peptidoglycan/LPS O-acetylase OafA/YrhL